MPARSIKFIVTTARYSDRWTVTGARIGKLVDPDTGASKWYVDPDTGFPAWCTPPAERSWLWRYTTPDACIPFGLTFEFSITWRGMISTQTALGHIRVDPTQLEGDHVVEVRLERCDLPGLPFFGLRTIVVSGPATVLPTIGQPICPAPPVSIVMKVDVEAALSNDLAAGACLVDAPEDVGPRPVDSGERVTHLVGGHPVVWRAVPVDPGTRVSIRGLAGEAVERKILRPVADKKHPGAYRSSFRPPPGAPVGTRYGYSVILDLGGAATRSFDACLQITGDGG